MKKPLKEYPNANRSTKLYFRSKHLRLIKKESKRRKITKTAFVELSIDLFKQDLQKLNLFFSINNKN